MKKTYRIKSDKDFQAIFSKGTSVANAVTRNSIKRKIRHVIMELSPNLLNQDFVIIARKGVEELDYHEVKKNLLHVLKLANLYQEGLNSEKKD